VTELDRRRASKLRNLRIANDVRQKRKQLKELVREGKLDPVKLIAGEYDKWEPVIQRWRISALVVIVPGVGPVTATEIYSVGQFSPSQRLSSLNERRRKDLARLCAQGRQLHGRG
jgi:hypothetical protein